MVADVVYLDASAIVRLVAEERGWGALEAFLRQHHHRATSALSVTEVGRAVRGAGARTDLVARADAVLDRLDLVTVSTDLLRRAAALEPATFRTLDAVHIATALELAPIAAFVTYDGRQREAAIANGLAVESPS